MSKIINLRTDYEILDSEFEDICKPFDDALDNWFEEHKYLIDEFVAFYIAKGIEYDALWSGAFSGLLNASVETLSEYFNDKNINRERLNKLLLNKYNLKLVQEKPMVFESIK